MVPDYFVVAPSVVAATLLALRCALRLPSQDDRKKLSQKQPVPYCGHCRKLLSRRRRIAVGTRVACRGDPKHYARVVDNATGGVWVCIAASFNRFEVECSPLKWLKKIYKPLSPGLYLLIRAVILLLFGYLVVLSTGWPDLCRLFVWGFIAFMTTYVILDILLVNTSTTFVSLGWKHPLRSALFVLFALLQLSVAFSVLYFMDASLWPPDSTIGVRELCDSIRWQDRVTSPLSQWLEAMYFSLATITNLGYGEYHPRCFLGKTVGIAQLACGYYFILIIVGTAVTRFVESPGH